MSSSLLSPHYQITHSSSLLKEEWGRGSRSTGVLGVSWSISQKGESAFYWSEAVTGCGVRVSGIFPRSPMHIMHIMHMCNDVQRAVALILRSSWPGGRPRVWNEGAGWQSCIMSLIILSFRQLLKKKKRRNNFEIPCSTGWWWLCTIKRAISAVGKIEILFLFSFAQLYVTSILPVFGWNCAWNFESCSSVKYLTFCNCGGGGSRAAGGGVGELLPFRWQGSISGPGQHYSWK